MRASILLPAVLVIAFTALYAVLSGLDGNWDLRNYHYWSVYAMFNGTTFSDIAPAQIQSWTNPLALVPAYAAISSLPPIMATALLGGVAGINGVLIFLLARSVITGASTTENYWTAILITICALTGPIFLSQTGTTFTDIICSIFVLSGLLALQLSGTKKFLISGMLLGAATGLKLTCGAFAIAMAIALLIGWNLWGLTIKRYALFATGGLLGTTLTAGYWTVLLYTNTGNPLFPYFNAFFDSSLFEPENFYDPRFLPDSLVSALSYPFQWAIGNHPSAEVPFRDPRFALLGIALPLAFIATWISPKSAKESGFIERKEFLLLSTFFVTSYIIWLAMWGIQRYITPLELLAGLLLFMSIDRLIDAPRIKLVVATGLLMACVAWSQPADWGRSRDYEGDFFDVSITPEGHLEKETLYVLIANGDPVSYIIPYLPRPARAVRLTGNMGELNPKERLGAAVSRAIEDHTGPLRTLSLRTRSEADLARLKQFGLQPDRPEDCVAIHTRHDHLESCRLRLAADQPDR